MSRPTFTRKVQFSPGYNHSEETGPRARGIHGMEIAFILEGPDGAVAFRMHTGWVPPLPGAKDSYGLPAMIHPTRSVREGIYPSGITISYHWRTRMHSEEGEPRPCPFLHDHADCWYDAGFSMSDPLLAAFIVRGEPAVWLALLGHYKSRLATQRAAERQEA